MFTIYSLYVHYIFTVCLQYIHYMFTVCSRYIRYKFTILQMTTRYDNFTDQVQKFGVQCVFLIFADGKFANDNRNA